ncbi:MAG: DUF4433 domain-containing protein [Kiritimatiellae bacterium]|nr:DUF4433 domain-containing protein [Kiritimatiellia bacterium]MBP5790997.1 DUF4433 domain-containing protein [Kiritimatiellia bacterium]
MHLDRLASVVREGGLYCDSETIRRQLPGTRIGLGHIKERRLNVCTLQTAPQLHVGDCVPFYFCPRSVMLFLIFKRNPDLAYRDGQEPIVHLVADMRAAIGWAQKQGCNWAFTNSNAGSEWFEDYNDMRSLEKLHWDIIESNQWNGWTDGQKTQAFKQAEFLVERFFPLSLVERIGVIDECRAEEVREMLTGIVPLEIIEIHRDWYY